MQEKEARTKKIFQVRLEDSDYLYMTECSKVLNPKEVQKTQATVHLQDKLLRTYTRIHYNQGIILTTKSPQRSEK